MGDTARKPVKRNRAVPVMKEEEMGVQIGVTAVDSGSKALQFLALHEDEPAGFSYDRDAPIDFPFDTATDLNEKERELQAKEAELKRREQEVKRKEEVAARAGIVLDEKNWPPFFAIIHDDIANEITIYLRQLRY